MKNSNPGTGTFKPFVVNRPASVEANPNDGKFSSGLKSTRNACSLEMERNVEQNLQRAGHAETLPWFRRRDLIAVFQRQKTDIHFPTSRYAL